MDLAALAEGFRQIEAITGRHQMTALLADLFRRGREDAGILPYLLEGRLGPPYAAPDLGMDERRIAPGGRAGGLRGEGRAAPGPAAVPG
ncbi:MAG: hypothetical protein HY689_16350 [Chloroflexi bacterium]|nr:hypothetical protein [Chloroflexota bacterium]